MITRVVRKVEEWFYAEDWRTWVSHLVILFVGCSIILWNPQAGAIALLMIYWFREILDARRNPDGVLDHTMDWLSALIGFALAMLWLA